jgi:hypothetical protein
MLRSLTLPVLYLFPRSLIPHNVIAVARAIRIDHRQIIDRLHFADRQFEQGIVRQQESAVLQYAFDVSELFSTKKEAVTDRLLTSL